MSAPVLIGCAAVALLLGTPVIAGAAALDARLSATGSADSAALAAADALNGWIEAEPCALAAEVAQARGHRLVGCEVDPQSGIAEAAVTAGTPFGEVSARARAGPPAP